MRLAIRNQLLNEIPELKECYEPNIPSKETEKPYAVMVAKDDSDNGEVVGFIRNIELWFYDERLSFKSLDVLVEKAIKALDLKVITNPKTSDTFTCKFNGIVGQDVVDIEWDANAKGLSFTIIALHEDDEINVEKWLDALSDYTKKITNYPIYLNSWKKDFKVPSILWRVEKQTKERESNALIKENKTLICHIASTNKNEINKLLDDIEDKLITDLKIPLDIEDRRYLTIETIEEDREADMLSKGQLTVKFFRRKMIPINDGPTIDKIYGRGKLGKED
ncbi:hypothetical protein NZ45_07940 [Clostridium botulinum]|uniref:PH domain-containing protein n=1 Tax=Clostridium botulinum TaxID=1491 RepID=A0ABD7CFY3_CLOBO|nr:hypothetical protein [Clostridium botulinum]KGO14282.1 hypothetical protein NZ45_07940 [Clostridium botulinum]QRI52263.1 hypothetical protein JQS73_12580 [Clostridium botulinum]